MFALGVAIEFCFMRRVRDQDRTQMSILVTYAVAIIIEGVLIAVFGVDYQQLSASYVNSSVHIFGFYLADIYLIGFGLALLLLVGLYYGLYRTKFGRAVRASLQNRTAADLIGIDVNRVRMLSVGVGVAVTAVGGMVFGATNSFNPNSGYDLISRLLAIVILGGMGSYRRGDGGRGVPAGGQRCRRGRVVADVGAAGVLRGPRRDPVGQAAGPVRTHGGASPMTESTCRRHCRRSPSPARRSRAGR